MSGVIFGMAFVVAMAAAVWLNDRDSDRAVWVLLIGWLFVLTLGIIGGA